MVADLENHSTSRISGYSSIPGVTAPVPIKRTGVSDRRSAREARDAFLYLQAERGSCLFRVEIPDLNLTNGFRLCRSLTVVLQLRQREQHSIPSEDSKYPGPEGYIGLVTG